MNWLDKIPFLPLLIIAILLGIAPYPREAQPHLVEKLSMLFQGTLSRPIDIFDLFLHGTPVFLLALKGIRALGNRKTD
jgi:hypothetical protein